MGRSVRFPRPRRFAVAQIDHVAMVAILGLDELAHQEAAAIRPKKYLIYLDTPLGLPLPKSQWARYLVKPVAAVLRPVSSKYCITADMVMPIFPNVEYAKGREPLCAKPDFPFSNCFFWIDSSMSLRIRPLPGGYDLAKDRGVELPMAAHLDLKESWTEDHCRMSITGRGESGRENFTASPSDPPPLRRSPHLSLCPSSNNCFDLDFHTDLVLSPEESESPPQFHIFVERNAFGWEADPKFKFIPLVDIFLELEEHLTADTIPSPTDLWAEQETIGAIIEAGLWRQLANLSSRAPIAHPSPPEDSLHSHDSHEESAADK